MDPIEARVASARKALSSLTELTAIDQPSAIERDAAIQRFEYTFEATWKACRHFLLAREGINAASPKAAMRSSLDVGLIDEPQCSLALQMADDRNLTVHTYNEKLADHIFSRLPEYALLLERWLASMENRLS